MPSPQAGRCRLCLLAPASVAPHPLRVFGALAQAIVHDEAPRHGHVEARLVRVRVRARPLGLGLGLGLGR